MNAYLHSEISVNKRGGVIEDYYAIHAFMDCTKDICSDNRHRILHTMWGINAVVVPVFGHSIMNADGKRVNVKDMCEQDHVLPDYRNRFIPTLNDFVEALEFEVDEGFKERINRCFARYKEDIKVVDLLLSPLHATGQLKSLVLTHNSWFLNFILPKIIGKEVEVRDFEFSASEVFVNMAFRLWMDNGSDYPQSCRKIISFT